ncbi:hypothetical protein BU23DRAFT_572224 [Bimuria novae-zelandiae CBS 107.79]|uniref:Uncharacterized protein n=1 Tax=Bimuria novae-zelandiae CBS 107.79 TaxID=1447943 RepID=A0A6A5UV09_9PLEO|nr:hypothetical protein BU23DRAFT_572224 [Bimuria novae-zelandiae CBS 107.79]
MSIEQATLPVIVSPTDDTGSEKSKRIGGTESTDSTEPTEPIEPIEPTEPTELTEPADPTESTEPAEPASLDETATEISTYQSDMSCWAQPPAEEVARSLTGRSGLPRRTAKGKGRLSHHRDKKHPTAKQQSVGKVPIRNYPSNGQRLGLDLIRKYKSNGGVS